MASRLPKSSLVALSLTVAVTAMAIGGSAYAQQQNSTQIESNVRWDPSDSRVATDQPATEEETAEPATDVSGGARQPTGTVIPDEALGVADDLSLSTEGFEAVAPVTDTTLNDKGEVAS